MQNMMNTNKLKIFLSYYKTIILYVRSRIYTTHCCIRSWWEYHQFCPHTHWESTALTWSYPCFSTHGGNTWSSPRPHSGRFWPPPRIYHWRADIFCCPNAERSRGPSVSITTPVFTFCEGMRASCYSWEGKIWSYGGKAEGHWMRRKLCLCWHGRVVLGTRRGYSFEVQGVRIW